VPACVLFSSGPRRSTSTSPSASGSVSSAHHSTCALDPLGTADPPRCCHRTGAAMAKTGGDWDEATAAPGRGPAGGAASAITRGTHYSLCSRQGPNGNVAPMPHKLTYARHWPGPLQGLAFSNLNVFPGKLRTAKSIPLALAASPGPSHSKWCTSAPESDPPPLRPRTTGELKRPNPLPAKQAEAFLGDGTRPARLHPPQAARSPPANSRFGRRRSPISETKTPRGRRAAPAKVGPAGPAQELRNLLIGHRGRRPAPAAPIFRGRLPKVLHPGDQAWWTLSSSPCPRRCKLHGWYLPRPVPGWSGRTERSADRHDAPLGRCRPAARPGVWSNLAGCHMGAVAGDHTLIPVGGLVYLLLKRNGNDRRAGGGNSQLSGAPSLGANHSTSAAWLIEYCGSQHHPSLSYLFDNRSFAGLAVTPPGMKAAPPLI